MQGAADVAKQILATDGIRGLYRGFGTVIIGVIPARGVSLMLSLRFVRDVDPLANNAIIARAA